MQVSYPNDVKIYNLSAGRSLPEWLSDRKKRKLLKNDSDLRRRIELIQDFEMPDVSSCVSMSKNGQYIFAAGTYKPRIRCYDVNDLSMKFERCLDSEVIRMELLSDGYEKLVFLEEERWVEFHVQYGRYYRTRIPKFGRDMTYDPSTCDLYMVGSGPDVYRLNLEQGQFMAPLVTEGSSLTACSRNPVHGLFVCGTVEGYVEAWDPRTKRRVATLDCALNSVTDDTEVSGLPSVSTIKFKDGLNMAVGTSTGQILLFDIRTNKPFIVKDHYNGLPVKSIEFCPAMQLVLSLDSRVVKMWSEQSGQAYTSIEPGVDLNQLCVVPDSGLMFVANEGQKILTFYVPSLGPAPRWCSFLDNITEELEESEEPSVYDDYKFITRQELQDIGLDHLLGSNLLRAFMHGYFIDMRLYNKAKLVANPFAYEDYRKQKIREKIDEERSAVVPVKNIPKVNRQLAERLMIERSADGKAALSKRAARKVKATPNLLEDSRFAAMFEKPEFQVDVSSEEYQLLNPALVKLDKERRKQQRKVLEAKFKVIDEKEGMDLEPEGRASGDESDLEASSDGASSSESEDDREYADAMRTAHRKLREEKLQRRWNSPESSVHQSNSSALNASTSSSVADVDMPTAQSTSKRGRQFRVLELKEGEDFRGLQTELQNNRDNMRKLTLGARLAHQLDPADVDDNGVVGQGNQEITFHLRKKKAEARRQKNEEHLKERKQVRRSVGSLQTGRKFFKSARTSR